MTKLHPSRVTPTDPNWEARSEPAPPAPPPSRPTAWQGVAGAAGFLAVYLAASVVYGVAVSLYLNLSSPEGSDPVSGVEVMQRLQTPGSIAGMLLFQTVLLLPVVLIASNFKDQSWKVTLALKPTQPRVVALWVGIFILYQALASLFESLVDVPVDPFIQLASGSRHFGLALAVTLLAPIAEETVFRGYLFAAWQHSRLRTHGTILVTSCLFLLMHAGQYNLLVLLQLFGLALIFGYARARSGSLVVPLILHALNNAIAAIAIIFLGAA